MKKIILLTSLFLASCLPAFSQGDSTSFFRPSAVYSPKRLSLVLGTEGAMYTVTMIGLNQLWYSDYPRSSFHFFNDNAEWLQMDKAGHFTTSFYVGKLGIDVMRWTGMQEKKAVIWGGLTGLMFETSIEIMDGFSTEWGFSPGDMTANTLGTVFVIGQSLQWHETRIIPKFSFHQTQYPQYRPNVLGKNLNENIIKDYNGQTYWLSCNVPAFFAGTKIPAWLSVAVGYGADGMTGGTENPTEVNGKPVPQFTRQRQVYLSLDIQLSKIKTKSRLLKTVFETIGFLKFPAPALEYNMESRSFKAYPLYF